MKTKTLVIIQIILLIVGGILFAIGVEFGMGSVYWLILYTTCYFLWGINVGIGIGSRNERE